MKLLILALCVVSATAFTKRCKSAEDCEEGECCVNYVLVSFLGGHCQKLREEGESCTPLLKENKDNPDMHHFQCPCKEGLECEATHQLKIGSVIIRHRPECVVPGEGTTVVEEVTDEGIIDEVTDEGIDEGIDEVTDEPEIGEPEAE